MIIGGKEFDVAGKTYIMGILNCTPDSFSDGGKYLLVDSAMRHAEKMIKEGADIIDVGGESTRPGYTVISAQEETERILPVIEKLKQQFDIVISVDTYKSEVAKNAIAAGADMINDIWGLKYDGQMAKVIAKSGVACCLMHNRDIKKKPYQADIISEMLSDLQESIDRALEAGIQKDKLITDPGVGFGKNYEENLMAIRHADRLKELGCPVLLGTSRKSVIGLTLNLDSGQRLEGTIATSVIGVTKGCSFIRVHDVLENKRAVRMTEAIMQVS